MFEICINRRFTDFKLTSNTMGAIVTVAIKKALQTGRNVSHIRGMLYH